jgi:hypothetical protein
MEVLSVLFIVIFVIIFMKLFALLLNTGLFLLTLPIKILSVLLSLFVVLVVLVPLGIIGAVAAILATPLLLIAILLPIVLIFYGLYHLIRNS